jgi:hypothetical protein
MGKPPRATPNDPWRAFYIERDDDEVNSLDSHWMYPAAPWLD